MGDEEQEGGEKGVIKGKRARPATVAVARRRGCGHRAWPPSTWLGSPEQLTKSIHASLFFLFLLWPNLFLLSVSVHLPFSRSDS